MTQLGGPVGAGQQFTDQQIQLAEANAGNLTRAVYSSYGSLPDPQLATESLLTGATTSVAGLAASADPQLSSILGSTPTGQTTLDNRTVPAKLNVAPNGFQFNQQQYDQQLKTLNNNPFASVGMMPVASSGWFNAMLNGSPDQVKKLQHFLADRGYYGTTSSDGKTFTPGEINGYSSPQFTDAMRQWAFAYFLPTALYSKDDQQRNAANQFLSTLGYSPDTLNQTGLNTPQKTAQVVEAWLQAQGPDQQQRDSIQSWADHFGKDTLPEAMQQLMGGSVWGSIADTLASLPIVGNITSLVTDPLTAGGFGYVHRFSDIFLNERDVRANKISAMLDGNAKEILAPAIQDIQQTSGFLGFLDAWDHARARGLLTLIYGIGDAIHGQGNVITNWFDSQSNARKGAAAHDTNVFAGLFGDKAAQSMPWLAMAANFTVNLADDPTVFVPFLGEIGLGEKLATGAIEMTKLEKATAGLLSRRSGALRTKTLTAPVRAIFQPTVRDALRQGGIRDYLDHVLNPLPSAQRDFAKLIGSASVKGDYAMGATLLGETDAAKAVPMLDQLWGAANHDDRLAMLTAPQSDYRHRLFDTSHLINQTEHLKVLSAFQRIDQQKQVGFLHLLHAQDRSTLLHLQDRVETAHTFQELAASANMSHDEVRDFTNKLFQAKTDAELRQVNLDFNAALDAALDTKFATRGGVAAMENDVRTARLSGWGMRNSPVYAYAIQHDRQLQAEETSLVDWKYTYSDPHSEQQAQQIRQVMQAGAQDFKLVYAQYVDDLVKQGVPLHAAMQQATIDPAFIAEKENHLQQLRDLRDHLEGLPGRSGRETTLPAPATSQQMRKYGHTKYSLWEILAYNNPTLWKMQQLQRSSDRFMSAWKSVVLTKPSTTARIVFGDEASRFQLAFALEDPATFLKYNWDILRRRKVDIREDMAMDLTDMVKGFHRSTFVPLEPGDNGYRDALLSLIRTTYGKAPETKVWTEGMKKGGSKQAIADLRKWLLGSSKEAMEFRLSRHIGNPKTGKLAQRIGKEDRAKLQALAEFMHADRLAFTGYNAAVPERRALFNALDQGGKVDEKMVDHLLRNYAQTGDQVLPRIQGRVPRGSGRAVSAMERFSDWYHHDVTQKWVTKARSRGLYHYAAMRKKQLAKVYGNSRTADWYDRVAMSEAEQWVRRNTYQGSRSIAATASRSAAPFYGATSNANRFYLRFLQQHPYMADPSVHALADISNAQAQGGLKVNVPLLGGLLHKFGLTAGDSLTFEPTNAFFLTREGFGGMIPGAGPVFNVLLRAGQFMPGLQQTVSQLPGMQYAATDTPVLPWAEEILSGISLAATGQPFGEGIPFIGKQTGYYEKQVDEKLQQQEGQYEQGGRQGNAPTVAGAARDVGMGRLLQGTLGATVPLGVQTGDQTQQAILQATPLYSQAQSYDQRRAIDQQVPQLADYFRYVDPETPLVSTPEREGRDAILARSPWVEAYATGKTVSTTGQATAEPTYERYQADIEDGSLRVLTPQEYVTKLQQRQEADQAWNAYDRLQASYQQWLANTGVASNSTEAQQWRQLNYDPNLQNILGSYPDWAKTFVLQPSQSSSGLQHEALPFSTLQAFEVLPQHHDFESTVTNLWRAALIRRDQATTALTQVIQQQGSQYEKDLIVQQLGDELNQLAQMDPTFAAQLSQYRFRQVEDLVNFQAQVGAVQY